MLVRVQEPNVISETIDGETIIINLLTGTYYSLRGTGVDAWGLLQVGATATTVAGMLALRYDGPSSQILESVEAFVADLEREGLVSVGPESETGPAVSPVLADGPLPSSERAPFTAPTIEAFTDLQDIILLDPVHEVSEQGWPHTQDAQTA